MAKHLSINLPLRGGDGAVRDLIELGPDAQRDVEFHRTLLDSFDWRIYQAGLAVEVDRFPAESRCSCRNRKSGSVKGAEPIADVELPRFAADFKDPTASDRLSEALGVRALMPRLEIRGVLTEWSHPNDDLRVRVGELSARSIGDEDWRELGLWLLAEGAGGAVANLTERMPDLASIESDAPVDLVDAALDALSVLPCDPSRLPILRIDPNERADQAYGRLFAALLATTELNRTGVLARIDPEFLHDFRVAVRRTRTLIGLAQGVYPESVRMRFGEHFANLASITSAPRDLDVHIAEFDAMSALLPKSQQPTLAPLLPRLQAERERVYAELLRYLRSNAYRQWIDAWARHLDKPLSARPNPPYALEPVGALAERLIAKRLKKVVKLGRALSATAPVSAVHDLRKHCKKLRYLLEFFRGLDPMPEAVGILKPLKRFQDHLGLIQDAEAQIAMLQALAAQLRDDRTIAVETLLAIGMLIDRLRQAQAQRRRHFAERFEAFEAKERRILMA